MSSNGAGINPQKMSLIKIVNDRLKQQFEDAKVNGANQFAPRDGYYHVKEVYYKFIGGREIPVALTNWKATLEEPFLTEVTFEIALPSIRLADDESLVVCYPGLVGLTIKIYDSAMVNIDVKGIMTPLYKCKYIVLTITSVFWSNSDLLIKSLGTPDQKLGNAHQTQLNAQGLDLSDVFHAEAPQVDDNNSDTQTPII